MKRVTGFLVLLILPLLLITGCQKQADPAPLQSSFTAEVSAVNGGATESYTVTTTGQGITTITYTQPQSMQGLTYSYKGNILTLKYSSLSYTPSGALPQSNMATTLYNILNTISAKQPLPDIQPQGDIAVHSNNCFKVTASTTTGVIQQISLKNADVIYTFSYK